MLITRKNYDSVIQTMITDVATDAIDYVMSGDARKRDRIISTRMIMHLFKPNTKIFLGLHIKDLINLTTYRLETQWMGKETEAAINIAKSETGTLNGGSTYYWKNYRTTDYVSGEDVDPWNKKREYIAIEKIEAIEIDHVSVGKSVIIGTLFFYDKFNIYQSSLMQFSLYGHKWYMKTAHGSEYMRVDSHINQLYNLQNY